MIIPGYTTVFRKLVETGVLSPKTGLNMEKLVRLRNLIIHRYWEVDDIRIYREFKEKDRFIIKKFIEEVEDFASRTRGKRIL